jgi:hypothetical protein
MAEFRGRSNIDKFCKEFKLPYEPGTKYIQEGQTRQKELTFPGAQAALKTLAAEFTLTSIRIFRSGRDHSQA